MIQILELSATKRRVKGNISCEKEEKDTKPEFYIQQHYSSKVKEK